MTVHNAAPYLRAAIDSIITQTFVNWELIVVENGSTDQSAEILKSYADQRIRIISPGRNIGRTLALRLGFANASGRYIAVLDADDVSAPERLAKQVALLDDAPGTVLVGTWTKTIDESGTVMNSKDWMPPVDAQELRERLAWANPFIHSSTMYRRQLAADVGGYPANFTHAQDAGLWLNLASHGEFAMIPEFLGHYRVVDQGLTQARENRSIVAREGLMILRSARQRLALSAYAIRRNREETLIAEIKYSLALMRDRAILTGLFRAFAAVMKHPTFLLRNRVVLGQFLHGAIHRDPPA